MRFDSRKFRPTVAAVFVAVALVLAIVPAGADHVVFPHEYSASVTPGTCELNIPCSLTFTIENESPPDSGYLIDGATIDAPSGITFAVASDPTVFSLTPKAWERTFSSSTLALSAAESPQDALLPGESVSVAVKVVATLLGPADDARRFTTSASGPAILPGGQPTTFENSGTDPAVTVVNDEVECHLVEEAGACASTVTLGSTSATAVASAGAETTLQLSVGGDFINQLERCQTDFTAKGYVVTSNVGGGRSHEVSLTLTKKTSDGNNSPGTAHFDICVGADQPFVDKYGNFVIVQNSFGFYEGVLPDCGAIFLGQTQPVTKCVKSRSRNAGNTYIKYHVDAGDPISIPGLDQI